MCAAIIRVIEDEHVTFSDTTIARHPVNHRLHRKGHDPNENRQSRLALNKRFARFRIIDAVAGVMRLGDDRIECRAEQRGVHFIGNLFQSPFQNGKGDRVHL